MIYLFFRFSSGSSGGLFWNIDTRCKQFSFRIFYLFFFPLGGFASSVGFLPMSLLSSSDEKDAFIWKLSLPIESVSRLFVVFITDCKNWSLSQNIHWFAYKSSVFCPLLLDFTLFSSFPNCPRKAFHFDLISVIWTSNSLATADNALSFTSNAQMFESLIKSYIIC